MPKKILKIPKKLLKMSKNFPFRAFFINVVINDCPSCAHHHFTDGTSKTVESCNCGSRDFVNDVTLRQILHHSHHIFTMCKVCHKLYNRTQKHINYTSFKKHFIYHHSDVIQAYKKYKGEDRDDKLDEFAAALRRRTKAQFVFEKYQHNLLEIERLKRQNEQLCKDFFIKEPEKWLKDVANAFDKEVEKTKKSLNIK